MKRIALLLVCAAGLGARAQDAFVISPADDTSTSVYAVSASGCGDTAHLRWTYTGVINGTPTDSVQIWATQQTACGDQPDFDDVTLATATWPTVISVRSGAFEVSLPALPMFDGGTCPAEASSTLLCASMPCTLGAGSPVYAKGLGVIVFDGVPPTAPVIVNSAPGDHSIDLFFTADNDTATVVVEVLPPGASGFQRLTSGKANPPMVTASSLNNGIEYRFRLIAVDAAGNTSGPSNELAATPRAPMSNTLLPIDRVPEKGCTSVPVVVVALAALAFRRRVSSR